MKNKYIVISREGGDFSMDLIFAGLVRKFGKENVIDYPARDKFRQGKPTLVGDDEKDYGAERRSLSYVEGCENLKRWSRPEIIQSLHNVKYIFMDETDESYEHWRTLMGIQSRVVSTIVIAGHDSFRGDPNKVRERLGVHFKHMFIDDWLDEYNNHYFKSDLINLSCNFDHLWNSSKREEYLRNKKYDLCFIGYNSHPIRRMIMNHVQEKYGHLNNAIIFEDRPNKFDKFIRHDEMFKMMAQSKVCLNLPGASTGGRALRYYEIPYVGSAMITMRVPAKLLYEFSHGINCLEFSSIAELDTCIDLALNHKINGEPYYNIIGGTGHDYCMKYHTIDARMNYVFEVLNE